MSKRTMILLGVAFICVIAAFFLQKHELTEPETEEETETEPEEETEQKPKTYESAIQKETATTGTETGSDKTE